MTFSTLAVSVSSRTATAQAQARGVSSTILQAQRQSRKGSPEPQSPRRYAMASPNVAPNTVEVNGEKVNEDDIIYVHNLGDKPGLSQVPRIIKYGSSTCATNTDGANSIHTHNTCSNQMCSGNSSSTGNKAYRLATLSNIGSGIATIKTTASASTVTDTSNVNPNFTSRTSGIKRYNSWSEYYHKTDFSFPGINTRSSSANNFETSCPYPTNGVYSYKSAIPPPARVFTNNENELDDLLGCLLGPLGFDMEWRVAYGSRTVPKTALIQVCDKNMIILVQVSSMMAFPEKLKVLLESPDRIKMGINISGDVKKLFKDYGIQMKGILELVDVARCYDPDFRIPGKWISLANIVAKYLGKELQKGPVRVSNWEAVLNEEQMEYAASDAYSALEVYKRIREIGKSCGVEANVNTLLDGKFKATSASTAASTPRTPTVTSTNATLSIPTDIKPVASKSDSKLDAPPAAHLNNSIKKGPTRQQVKAYSLWYEEKKHLDEICASLRTAENPLKRGTVIGYIVSALKADTSLGYDLDELRELLFLDYLSYKRHERWYKLRRAVAIVQIDENEVGSGSGDKGGDKVREMIGAYDKLLLDANST